MDVMFYVSLLELVLKREAIKAHMRNIHILLHVRPSTNNEGKDGYLQAIWDLCKEFGVSDLEWAKKLQNYAFTTTTSLKSLWINFFPIIY